MIDALATGAEPGLVATAGPRHFGFVIGGALPAALAADWLVSAWDQNAAFHSLSPAAAAIEEITSAWTLELLGLPDTASVGFVTGGQGANTTCLAAARHAVLSRRGLGCGARRADWRTDRSAFCVASRPTPRSTRRCVCWASARRQRSAYPPTTQGRMDPDALAKALAANDGPTIVCAQAGNVATGAFDAFGPIADACAQHGAWLHVDGAFGLWAAAAPATRAPHRRRRACGLLGGRRAQVAQCALRRRDGDRRRPGRSPRRDELGRALSCGRSGPARQHELRAGEFAPRPGGPRLRRDTLTRPHGGRRDDRTQLRAGASNGQAARQIFPVPRFSTTSSSIRCWSACPAATMPTAPPSPRSSVTEPVGSAGPPGTVSTCCGCRFRTGRRRMKTSTARPPRSPLRSRHSQLRTAEPISVLAWQEHPR